MPKTKPGIRHENCWAAIIADARPSRQKHRPGFQPVQDSREREPAAPALWARAATGERLPSELMIGLRSVLGQRKDFGTIFGHQDGVFELCGQLAIARAHGPSVMFVEHGIAFPGVDHWFDSEADAGIESILA